MRLVHYFNKNRRYKYSVKLSLVFFLLFLQSTLAQHISGKIVDIEHNPLEFVAAAIINPIDSTLISYASTDQEGVFKLTQIPTKQVLLQFHLIGFKTKQRIINFENKSMDLGTIILEFENILDEIVITAITPISIKKDTVVYNTAAFKIKVDDSVEDLIKKLPGVEVDANGKITAQGEEVMKIYIDGKEFFSNDPTIATKNFSADAIARIEVIDENSDAARVTGINDSQRNKVINLVLKETKKANDFGKVQGGYGTDERFLTSLNYNRFSSKVQISLIGKYNNINSTGSDISEILSFNTGNGNYNVDSGSSFGYLTTGVAGLNFGYEFKEKQHLNIDYFYNYSDKTSGDIKTTRKEYIKDVEILSESEQNIETVSNNQKVNFVYKDRSKELSTYSIRGVIRTNDKVKNNNFSLDKYNGEGELDLQNTGVSTISSKMIKGSLNASYVKRFSTESKRNIFVRGSVFSNTTESDNINNQLTKFKISKPSNSFKKKQLTTKKQDNKNATYSFLTRYTEPIFRNGFILIEAEYKSIGIDQDVAQLKFINDTLQNPLIYSLIYKPKASSGNLWYKYDNGKITLTTGVSILYQQLSIGAENEENFKSKQTYFNPELRFRYRPERGKYIYLNIKKGIKIPSINQMSPVVNNFNSLNIWVGNPTLTPEEKINLSGILNRYNFASGFNFASKLSYFHKTNSIIRTEFTDDLGVRYNSFENYGKTDNFNLRFDFGNRIKAIYLRYQIVASGGLSNYNTRVNGDLNKTNSKDILLGFSLQNNNKNNFDAIIGINFNKNFTTISNQDIERSYYLQSYYAKLDWDISEKLNLNSQFKYDIYTDDSFNDKQKVPIWNASVSYSFLKSNAVNLKFTAIDILNNNIGLIRNSANNYFEEVQREVLGSYFMLSLTYNLNGKNRSKSSRKTTHRNY